MLHGRLATISYLCVGAHEIFLKFMVIEITVEDAMKSKTSCYMILCQKWWNKCYELFMPPLEHNILLSTSHHDGNLFRTVFRKIAQKYGCARTKTFILFQYVASKTKK